MPKTAVGVPPGQDTAVLEDSDSGGTQIGIAVAPGGAVGEPGDG